MTELRARNLHAAYGGREVLRGIDLAVRQGEVLGILGANGAGKSTLLRLLAGLHAPASGAVEYDGRPLAEVQDLARRLAYLEQHTRCHWPLAVERLVALGRLPYLGFGQRMRAADHAAVEQAMAEADVLNLRQRPATDLSTGERARAFLARALAVQPELLLVDEPVSGLDPAHQLAVMALLERKAAQGMGVVAVLHDLSLAVRYCRRVVLLHEGRILAEGAPDDVLTQENLRTALDITALRGNYEGVPYLVPWSG